MDEALKELETCAQTRVRQDGANEDRSTGNLVLALAVYQHDTSREPDPQLHTHAVAANLTYDGTEGRWKALQASEIYDCLAYLTEVYRNALAREVRRLGYEIVDRRDGRGRDQGFEIRGISEKLLEDFSQRSAQRNRAIAEFVQQTGRQPSDNRWPSWCGSRDPISKSKSQPKRCEGGRERGCLVRTKGSLPNFEKRRWPAQKRGKGNSGARLPA